MTTQALAIKLSMTYYQSHPCRANLVKPKSIRLMLSLCQKVAVEANTVGMPQFQEMYNTVEVLLHNWQTGLKCIVVTCSDEK